MGGDTAREKSCNHHRCGFDFGFDRPTLFHNQCTLKSEYATDATRNGEFAFAANGAFNCKSRFDSAAHLSSVALWVEDHTQAWPHGKLAE
jgi:hypothetical protein